jgi:hypothetical protein
VGVESLSRLAADKEGIRAAFEEHMLLLPFLFGYWTACGEQHECHEARRNSLQPCRPGDWNVVLTQRISVWFELARLGVDGRPRGV